MIVLSGIDPEPSEQLRGWWKWNPERTKAVGLDESLSYLKGILKERTFDVRILLQQCILKLLPFFVGYYGI
jgi:hypothetical protein